MIDPNTFCKRRERFLSQLEDVAAIIPAATMVQHHSDCEYPFRQNSDFWYLTGFDEPNAIALFLPHRSKEEQYVLFVLPKQRSLEVWNGFREGIEGAVSRFGANIAHPIDEFHQRLSEYLRGASGIAFRVGKHPKIESIVLKSLSEQLDQVQRNGLSPMSLISPCSLLHKMRLYKDSGEIDRLKIAAQISAEAHELAHSAIRPGMNERELQALIEKYFLDKGARGPAYGSIVAGGDNACILHYTDNNSELRDGDLVLIDAGCSLTDYYNGDITRTFPVNGNFSGEQLAIYEIVLAAQEAAIKSVVPGEDAEKIHLTAVRVLVDGLVEIGLLSGDTDSLIEQGAYTHLYMHRTGHWLGLDVHDVGAYRLGDYPVLLEPSMVLTVEHGIYISDRLPVPDGQPSIDSRWKGIGVRIEDDVLVRKTDCEVMTSYSSKKID